MFKARYSTRYPSNNRPAQRPPDEASSFVGKKQKNVLRHEIPVKGDQYVFIGMAGTQKAIIGWRVGKRNADTTLEFLHDLRQRVIGQPEISTDGFLPYRNSIRDTFGGSASHGVIVKTYSVTHLVKEAQGRYSPAAVVAVSREVVSAIRISTFRPATLNGRTCRCAWASAGSLG